MKFAVKDTVRRRDGATATAQTTTGEVVLVRRGDNRDVKVRWANGAAGWYRSCDLLLNKTGERA